MDHKTESRLFTGADGSGELVVPHRRTSSSSCDTLDSLPRSIASSSSASDPPSIKSSATNDEQTRLVNLISKLKTLHPFSALTQLTQLDKIHHLSYVDLGCSIAALWTAEIKVHCPIVGWITRESSNRVKSAAKKLAAADVLDAVHNGTSSPSLPRLEMKLLIQRFHVVFKQPFSPVSSLEFPRSSPSDESPLPPPNIITKKQARVLEQAQKHLDFIHHLAHERRSHAEFIILAVDVEKNERGSELLEVGLAWVYASASLLFPEIDCVHLVIEDHRSIRNFRKPGYDNRDNFNFGTSEPVAEAMLAARINTLVEELTASGHPLILVGHSIHNDIAWLSQAGVVFNMLSCDLGQAYQARLKSFQLVSLARMMDAVDVDHCNCHNGGNDAYYTLETGLRMLDMMDVQHENARERVTSLL